MGTVCQHDIVLHIVCTYSSTGASTMQISGLGSTIFGQADRSENTVCHQITTLSIWENEVPISLGPWGLFMVFPKNSWLFPKNSWIFP